MADFLARLKQFLHSRDLPDDIEKLTQDASTREYFRVKSNDRSAIACVYPEGFVASEQNYLDVTSLFAKAGLPVAEIFDFDEALGVILQEDLGDVILRDVIVRSDDRRKDELIRDAVSLIPTIQAATDLAFTEDSVASQLRFDSEKLIWELEFFKTHYFTTYKGEPLSPAEDVALVQEFGELSKDLEERARVLCHRDFHAANLMVDQDNRLRIIDHQDARIGSVAYDLVSLLLDRVTEPPSAEWLSEKRRYFLAERERLGLAKLDEHDFANEFRLQTVQRCLKAVGTFSYQSVNRGKTYFVPFIKPMFQIVLRALDNLDRFPTLRDVLDREIG